ncbi:hypothetical protein BKA70DRAFT_396838 [Coprinopsis sp. MPI-PUGE-AT-0042]|nr:hypothetical protein BKA70DRAFT_396838 [Coprinopsis sp. MPI-PUGE-AT-0042]
MDTLSPQVDSYSHNNIPLPDGLVPEWSRYLDDLSSIIAVVDEKVAALESVLAIAKQRQAELKKRKTQVTSFRSPIRRLPAEIIASILLYALEPDVLPLNHTGRLQFLAFRSVCSLWRTTAFSTLDLWRALDVDVSHWDQSGPTAFTAAMTSWFSRAGPEAELHLTVCTTASSPSSSINICHITSLIDTALLPISTLEIKEGTLHNEEDLKVLVTATSARPTVKFLMVPLLSKDQLDYGINDFGHLHETYPSLERLALTGTDNHVMYQHESLAWLSIEVPFIYPSMYLWGLPALEELVLSLETSSWDDRPVLLGSLKRLTVKNRSTHCVLPPLTCPSLEFVHLVDIFTESPGEELKAFVNTLERLLGGSQANRVTLRITNDSNATLLRRAVLDKPGLKVHRLEIQDISSLLRAEEFKRRRELPRTLEEIIVWQKPRTDGPQTLRELHQPKTWSQIAGQSTARSRPTQTVTVYIPGGREDAKHLEANEENWVGRGTLSLQFLGVRQNVVSRMLWETGGCIPKAVYRI